MLRSLVLLEGFLLHQLVHPVYSLVVFPEASSLPLLERQVLLLEFKFPHQVLNIPLELLILLLDVLSEGLLVLQVPPESLNLAIVKVDFILLRSFRLHHHVELLLEGLDLTCALRELPLELVDLLL